MGVAIPVAPTTATDSSLDVQVKGPGGSIPSPVRSRSEAMACCVPLAEAKSRLDGVMTADAAYWLTVTAICAVCPPELRSMTAVLG